MTETLSKTEVKSVNLLHELIAEASEQGAVRALARLGLSDEGASKDMAELRELLSAWRDAKRSARKAAIGWVVRMGLALVLIGLAVKLGLPAMAATFRQFSARCGWLAR